MLFTHRNINFFPTLIYSISQQMDDVGSTFFTSKARYIRVLEVNISFTFSMEK